MKENLITGTEPRFNYYNFAHRLLPHLIFTDVADFCRGLNLSKAVYLNQLWQKLGEDTKIVTTPSEKIVLHQVKINDLQRLFLIKLPPPQFPLECYWVGLLVDLIIDTAAKKEVVKCTNPRYFTLELSGTADDWKARSFFGEWQQKGLHLNYGEISGTSQKAFEIAIRQKIGQ